MTGIFELGKNNKPQTGVYKLSDEKKRGPDYRPLGTCVACGGKELELNVAGRCLQCKGGRVKPDEDDGIIYDLQ